MTRAGCPRRACRRGTALRPSARGTERTIGRTSSSRSIGARIFSPSTGCSLTISNSSAVSGPGRRRISDGIADLADVVEERTELEALDRVAVEPSRGRPAATVGDPPRVRGRVLVARLERVGERGDGRDEGALETRRVLGALDRKLRLMCEPDEQAKCRSSEDAVAELRRTRRRDCPRAGEAPPRSGSGPHR